MNYEDLAQKLRAEFEREIAEQNITLSELASRRKRYAGTMHHALRSGNTPKPSSLEDIADALGYRLDWSVALVKVEDFGMVNGGVEVGDGSDT